MSVSNSTDEENSRKGRESSRKDERPDGGHNSYDLGVHPIRQSYDNYLVHGGPSHHGQNDYGSGYPPIMGNGFRDIQSRPYYNHGNSSDYGRIGFDSGNPQMRFPPYYNPTYYENPGNGRSAFDFGYPPNRSEFQYQPCYNPFVHGGPSSYGRNEYDSGNQPNRNDSSQLYPPNVFGFRSYHHGRSGNDSSFSDPPHRAEDRQLHTSINHESNEGAKNINGGNVNEKQDADSKIEHQKLKIKITNLYKLKAPLNFSKNSANFEKDDWVKVWYVGSEGYKLYQSLMNCPICFKKVTPQNRAGAGNLPRWELTLVKGHLERLHPEGKPVQKEPKTSQSDDGEEGKDVANNEILSNVGQEGETDKQGKDENSKDVSADDLDTLQSLPQSKSNLLSSPESKSSLLSPPESERSDALSESTESEEIVEPPKKKRLRRKTNEKRGDRDAGMKRKRDEFKDWKKPGVEFAWVKFTSSSRFLPAFVFPLEKGKKKREARQILTKTGELEEKKHEVAAIATPLQVEQTKKLPKTKPYLAALKQFNSNHNTNFQ